MKRKHPIIQLLLVAVSLLLCMAMFTSCGIVNIILCMASPDFDSAYDSFEGLEYERPDFAAIKEGFQEATNYLKNGSNTIRIQQDVYETYGLYNDAYTQYNILQIKFYTNIDDDEIETELDYCAEQFSLLDPIVNDFYLAILDNGFADFYLSGWSETDIEYVRLATNLYDNEYTELYTERTGLENDYVAASVETTVEYGFGEYTFDEIYEMYSKGKLARKTYTALLQEYYEKLSAAVTPIYRRMIEIDNIFASKMGFASSVEFSYKFTYSRDYSPEDAEIMYRYVKEYIVPFYLEISEKIDFEAVSDILQSMNDGIFSYDSIFRDYTSDISPDMLKAYKALVNNELYTIGNTSNMQQAAFTTYLPSYETPYMYIYTYGDLSDITTFVHEFGHFYAYYFNGFESDNIIDVSEIHSQANEWLFLPYYDLSDDERSEYALYLLANSLEAIIEGCMYDEFQQAMYENEALDPVSTFNSIAHSYSYNEIIIPDLVPYAWAGVHHNFTAPFYYLSYAVSALPALEVYVLSTENRDEAIDIYNSIIDETGYSSYLTVLDEADLGSPFEESTYEELVSKLSAITEALAATKS